jgi:hypothetical protein
MMLWRISALATCGFVALLSGCASPDRVVFVTTTELGVGLDGTTGVANIGYDRNEAVVGPDYPEEGALPPVYARLRSSGNLFQPGVSQIYATGDAAVLATAETSDTTGCGQSDRRKLSGKRRLAVFGTSTNFGLKVQFVQSVPGSINFGYKRKELSWLPLNEDPPNDGTPDKYPSVIAGVGIGTNISQDKVGVSYGIDQFVATGDAADRLACKDEVREVFKKNAKEALDKARKNVLVIPEADTSP